MIPLEDTFLKRVVLLKIMQSSEHNLQLYNEIKGLCKARSMHVVDVYDIVYHDNGDVAGVIIERLRGRDFSEFYLEAYANPHLYLKVLYQLACALRDIHSVGIIHRDLKLDNFKESSSGIVKLYDFGLSSFGEDYKTRENKGTLVYAAPELYVGNVTISAEMDIYAFGVCAWALASKAFPFPLLECPPQSSSRAPSIKSVMPVAAEGVNGIHDEVFEVLDACLSPHPEDRPNAYQLSVVLSESLTRNKHRGLFVQDEQKVFELSFQKPVVSLKIGSLGKLKISYDGLNFSVSEIEGAVSINNQIVESGYILPSSCVIGFGDESLGYYRQWVSFFSSHPEVVL